MWLKILAGVMSIVCLAVLGWYGWMHFAPVPKKIHIHAGFLVYVDGVKQDFTGDRYMNLEFCGTKTADSVSAAELQKEKAHLHDNVGDVVHVHREGAVWGDLFRNMGYSFPDGKPVVGYVDGNKVSDILGTGITPYSSVLIVVGDATGVDVSARVPVDHIKAVEKTSESCGNP